MKYKTRYSIGDVSRICRVSKKALRYYDEIGLITSKRQDFNNYRYYTYDSLLSIPIIKYYKQMGFTLEEMRELIEGKSSNVHRALQQSFLKKINALELEQEELRRKYMSVRNWYDLILEAEQVVDNSIDSVSIRFVERVDLLFQEQDFDNNIKASVINIEFSNHLEHISNEIAGPIILHFFSHQDRVLANDQRVEIMQKPLLPCAAENLCVFGGCMMAACYHIGSHDNISDTYQKIYTWTRENNYTVAGDSYERFVTDYWTTRNTDKFVTEVLIPVTR